MPAETLTGEELLAGFSKFIGDYWQSTTTATGTSTTLVDNTLGRWGDNALVDRFIRRTATEEVRRAIVPFTRATGELTVQPAFSTSVGSGITYQLHRYDPVEKWRALDTARLAVLPWLFKEVRDDTVTADGRNDEFPIPAAVDWGPELCYIETPLDVGADWNLITDADARGKEASNWTASNVTVSTYAKTSADALIPKHEDTCLKLVTTGTWTYTLTVSNFDGITAASAAGRHVEYGMWVYSLSTSPALKLLTDAGTLATGTAHQGKGWELLRVEGDVAADNATTLSVQLAGSGTLTLYRENAFFVFGQLPNPFDEDHPLRVERDETIQRFRLPGIPLRGRQIRLIGKAPLSALGTSGQAAATMELNERSAQILYAAAAEELFGLELLSSPAMKDVLSRIAVVKDKRKAFQKEWKHRAPAGRVVSPYEA